MEEQEYKELHRKSTTCMEALYLSGIRNPKKLATSSLYKFIQKLKE